MGEGATLPQARPRLTQCIWVTERPWGAGWHCRGAGPIAPSSRQHTDRTRARPGLLTGLQPGSCSQVCAPSGPGRRLPQAPGRVPVPLWRHLQAGAVVSEIEETSQGPCPLPRSLWLRPMGAACGHRCLGEGGGPGGPWERGTQTPGQHGPHSLPASSQLPRRDAGPPGLLPSQAPAARQATMLHRRRLRAPEPVGHGLTGPSPWWDLSPALTMRLHLLASLSGGGLAWRAGDNRWLAGEGQVCWAWGVGGSMA